MISISLVSHGQMPLVYRLLDSLEQVLSSGIPLEVILTENQDRSEVAPREFTRMTIRTVVNEMPYGLAKNHNQAFQMATGDYFCVMNPDVVFVEDVFPRLISQLESRGAEVVAPLLVDGKDNLQDSFRDLPTPLDLIRRRLGMHKVFPPPIMPGEIIHPDWIAGIFLLMRTETYRQLGGFDERFHLYFEDVDFCSRARIAGLSLAVDTSCRIVHDARRASERSPRHFLWHLVSAGRFFTSPVYWQSRSLRRASK
jgi:N-acetylglucosaminyl-diphospho-decaprenol L-rhamnosyltransferase